jgi:hypothetical protein
LSLAHRVRCEVKVAGMLGKAKQVHHSTPKPNLTHQLGIPDLPHSHTTLPVVNTLAFAIVIVNSQGDGWQFVH